MSPTPANQYWPADGLGGAVVEERHFGDRLLRCFAERPARLDALFAATVARGAEREALVGDGRRITYGELDGLVSAAAAGLWSRGIRPGERVALLLGNCPEFLVAVLGCARLGAIAVPLGTRQRAAELDYLLNDCGAAALIFEAEFAANLPSGGALPSLRRRIVVGGAAEEAEPIEALIAPGQGPVPPAPTAAEGDTAVILYTSGTTGKPKGAMLSHLGLVHSAMTLCRCLGLGPADRTVLAVPAAHVTGLVAVLLAMVEAGGCTVLMRTFKASAFLALAAAERMSYAMLVPAMYILSLRAPGFAEADLASWRIGAYGGAPMPEAIIAELAQRLPNLVLVNAYGATETTSPTTIMPPGLGAAYPDSIGQVVPCGEVRVVDPAGAPVAPGTAGEIWIRGPMVVAGYWQRPEATSQSFTEGFWHSGDVGSIDALGFVRLFDRLKDMINRAGYKVYSAEVENALSHHPDVIESAVVGRPDPVLGERVQAFVRLRPESTLTADDIRAFCAERLADYKVPELVELMSEPLPRNANGKVQKALLRQGLTPPPLFPIAPPG